MTFFITIAFLITASISPQKAHEIALRVWQNECAATIDGLISWNEGEEFASLGIGHFIWYPSAQGPYAETFPTLLRFIKSKGIRLPHWLKTSHRCPWKSKKQFRQAFGSKKMLELKQFLKETIDIQAEFLVERLHQTLPEFEAHLSKEQKETILPRYHRLAESSLGLCILVDYINFKGYGTSTKERYQGQGWGLAQVLERMHDDLDPIEEFMRSAKEVLTERVKNSPPERHEERFLDGWISRIGTYQPIPTQKR